MRLRSRICVQSNVVKIYLLFKSRLRIIFVGYSIKVRVCVLDGRRLYNTPCRMRNSDEMTIRKTYFALLQRVVYLLLLHVIDELSTRYFTIVVSISLLN